MFPPALIDALYASSMAKQRRRNAAAEQACVGHAHHPQHREVTAHPWRRWKRWPSSNIRRTATSTTGKPEGPRVMPPAGQLRGY